MISVFFNSLILDISEKLREVRFVYKNTIGIPNE